MGKKKKPKNIYQIYKEDNVYFIDDIFELRNRGYSISDIKNTFFQILVDWEKHIKEREDEFE